MTKIFSVEVKTSLNYEDSGSAKKIILYAYALLSQANT